MFVEVRLYGTLRRFSDNGIWRGEIPAGSTVRDLIELIGSSEKEVAVASINGKACGFAEIIPPEGEVVLVTPMGGG